MLASPANQLTNTEATVVTPTRTANILRLEFSRVQHEPVLLSPGKWSIGASTSNQIVLDHDGVALRQFLIIVTEHRSVIKDWSSDGLWNGKPFESAVLSDGDKIEIANVELSFRLAKSLDLISQLPYVADNDSAVEACEESQQNTVHVTADGMLSFEDSAERLDELINRIESSVTSDPSSQSYKDFNDYLPQGELRTGETHCVSDKIPASATRPDDATMELQSARIDEDLRQLEELRAAVQQEREQLLERRALLVQESLHVESQLKSIQDGNEALPSVVEEVQCCDRIVDEPTSAECYVDTEACNEIDTDEVSLDVDEFSLESLAAQHETETVAAEREKLRHLLEEFDSVDEANDGEAANVKVTVGAAQTNAEYSVMNALRSRDDAVKQLDDLVLAATGGQERQIPASGESLPGRVADVSVHETSRRAAILPESEFSSVSNDADSYDHSVPNDEPSSEYGPESNVEASIDELGNLIDTVDPETTRSLAETDELSSDERTPGSEVDEEAVVDARDETVLVERGDIENQIGDEAAVLDLTALTREVDASSEVSYGSVADVEDVPIVKFEAEGDSPEFDRQVTKVAGVDREECETDSAQQDSDEGSFTLQCSDIYEIVEEPQSEPVAAEQYASQETTSDRVEGDALVFGANSESFDTDSDAETSGENLEADESTQANEDVPSWFDSKFMAEGDTAAENDPLVEESASEPNAVEDADGPDSGEPAADLRQKLAEMFDLPDLAENTGSSVPDETLESRLQQFRDEPQSEVVPNVQADIPSSAWPNAESSDAGIASDATLNVDLESDSAAEDVSAFESETLDEFPSTSSEENIETDSPAVSETTEAFEPEEVGEEDTSISAYMERLLARNRQVTGSSATTDESTPTSSVTESKPSSNTSLTKPDHEADDSTAAEKQRENWLEENPRHRQNRDQVRAEVQVLRQIANQSARSAVATASRRDIRKQVIVKTIASVLALASGVAALLLDVSMLFGLTVLTFGLLFAGDLALTIFRNWKSHRDLERAASELNGGASSKDDDQVSGNVDSLPV